MRKMISVSRRFPLLGGNPWNHLRNISLADASPHFRNNVMIICVMIICTYTDDDTSIGIFLRLLSLSRELKAMYAARYLFTGRCNFKPWFCDFRLRWKKLSAINANNFSRAFTYNDRTFVQLRQYTKHLGTNINFNNIIVDKSIEFCVIKIFKLKLNLRIPEYIYTFIYIIRR